MRIEIVDQFLTLGWATGREEADVNYEAYTLDEIKSAAAALNFLIETMESDKFDREYDAKAAIRAVLEDPELPF